LLCVAGQPAATALGVVEEHWLGISCVATDPTFRRRGCAQQLMAALFAWAIAHGTTHAWLQVMQHNAPALALYAQLGFATAYHYHYRELKSRD
jgi:N-acetylglutamate synthase